MDANELDGPIAAPANHRVVFENDRVRVLETVIPAGERTPIHTHLVPHVIVVRSGTDFIRRDAGGNVLVDTRTLPAFGGPDGVLWSDGLGPHSIENVGPDAVVVHAIEIKPTA